MRTLIALFVLLPSLLFGQGFGSYSHDQPFFGVSSGAVDPGSPTNVAPASYYWVAEDIASGSAASPWVDRINGKWLYHSNSWNIPTNSANGVCFDGNNKWFWISNGIYSDKTTSWFITFQYSKSEHYGNMFTTNNSTFGYNIQTNGNLELTENGVGYNLFTDPGTNLSFLVISQTNYGANGVTLVTYTNGVLASSNNTTSWTRPTLDVFGGGALVGTLDFDPVDQSLTAWVQEICVWTNYTLTPADVTYLASYKQAKYGSPNYPQFFNYHDKGDLKARYRADGINFVDSNIFVRSNLSTIFEIANSVFPLRQYVIDVNSVGNGWIWSTNSGPRGPAWNLNIVSADTAVTETALPLTHPVTYIFVVQQTNNAAQAVLLNDNNGGNYIDIAAGGGSASINSGATLNLPSLGLNSWTVLTVCFNGANSYVRTNGTLVATGDAGSTSGTKSLRIGRYIADTAPFFGKIAEFLVYSGNLDTNNLASVEQALKTRHGL